MLSGLEMMEKQISDAIITFSNFFSLYKVWTYIDATESSKIKADSSKSTIRSHFRSGRRRIPPEYFRKYIDAWKSMNEIPRKLKKEYGSNKEVWRKQKACIISFLEKVVDVYEKQLKPFNLEIVSSFFNNDNATENLSPLFAFRLCESFDSFLTINPYESLFLTHFFVADEAKKERIIEKMNTLDGVVNK